MWKSSCSPQEEGFGEPWFPKSNGTWRRSAQINPLSSRATATTTFCRQRLRCIRAKKRRCSRICAFPAQLLDPLGLVLLAFTEFFAHFGRESVVLSALDQNQRAWVLPHLVMAPRCWRSPVL